MPLVRVTLVERRIARDGRKQRNRPGSEVKRGRDATSGRGREVTIRAAHLTTPGYWTLAPTSAPSENILDSIDEQKMFKIVGHTFLCVPDRSCERNKRGTRLA